MFQMTNCELGRLKMISFITKYNFIKIKDIAQDWK